MQGPIPPDLLEVLCDTRKSGVGQGVLACFKHVKDFDPGAICRPRDCKRYYPWDPGHSPKEHTMLKQVSQTEKAQWRAIGVSIVFGIVGTILGVLSRFG